MTANDLIETVGYEGNLTSASLQNMIAKAAEIRKTYGEHPVIIGAFYEPMNALYGYIFESPKWPGGYQVRTSNVAEMTELDNNVSKVLTESGTTYLLFS